MLLNIETGEVMLLNIETGEVVASWMRETTSLQKIRQGADLGISIVMSLGYGHIMSGLGS